MITLTNPNHQRKTNHLKRNQRKNHRHPRNIHKRASLPKRNLLHRKRNHYSQMPVKSCGETKDHSRYF